MKKQIQPENPFTDKLLWRMFLCIAVIVVMKLDTIGEVLGAIFGLLILWPLIDVISNKIRAKKSKK